MILAFGMRKKRKMSLSKFIEDYTFESHLYAQTSHQLCHELEDQIDEVFNGREMGEMIYSIEETVLNSVIDNLKE